MKKYVFLAAAAVSALFLASCSQDEPEDLPGILINGVRWAPTNVAAPGVFAASVFDAGLHYQWGRRTGWLGSSDDTPPISPPVSSPAGQTWNSTPEAGVQWEAAADPCPEGWRLPTQKDFDKLLDYEKVSYLGTSDDPGGIGVPPWGGSRAEAEDDTLILSRADPFDREGLQRREDDDLSGGKGIIFTDRQSGEKLFLPAAGMIYTFSSREEPLLVNPGTDGFYWFLWVENDLPGGHDIETEGCYCWFAVRTDQTPPGRNATTIRQEGFSVRCVLKQ